MDNLLRKVESDEVVVYTDQVYSIDVLNKCREIHQKLVDEGKPSILFILKKVKKFQNF